MAKVDFDSIVGGTKKKTPEDREKEPVNKEKNGNAINSNEKPQQLKSSAQNKNDNTTEKLENEFMGFHSLPKEEREKRSEEFDFKQITEQIKEKVSTNSVSKGFDEKVVEKAA